MYHIPSEPLKIGMVQEQRLQYADPTFPAALDSARVPELHRGHRAGIYVFKLVIALPVVRGV